MPPSVRTKKLRFIVMFLVLIIGKIPFVLISAAETETQTIRASGSIIASSGEVTYNLQLDVQGLGYISESPGGEYVSGSVVTLTGVPSPGWEFTGWSGDLTGSDDSKTIIIDGNKVVTATFSKVTLVISSSHGPGGAITPLGSQAVADGGSQRYTITPESGYHILDVLVDGVSVGAVGTYDFTNILSDHMIEAQFMLSTGGSLEVSNHDSNIEGGSGSNWQKTGENEFSFTLDWDITSPDDAEKYWFMYKITGNAGGKTVTYDANIQNTIGSRTGYTPAYSYDNGNSWQYIPQEDVSYYDNGNNHLVYSIDFPVGQETALIAATMPIQYSWLSQYTQSFSSNVGYVSSYPSEFGRDVYVFTIDDGEPEGKPIMWVIAGQEPSEHWSQYMALGFVEYLLSPEASTLRQEHIWKIIPSINPDGVFLGKTQRNGLGNDLTTQWDDAMVGNADAEIQGIVDLMKEQRGQGYVFDGFIDLHVYYSDVWKIIRSTNTDLFDDYDDQTSFVNRISSDTYWGKDGISSSTNLAKSWGAIPNEFGCPTVLLEANQWRSDLEWNVPANVNNLYYQGERLAESLEGFLSQAYLLTVNILGTGSVSRNPDRSSYVDSTTVTLTAVPNSGWEFTGWSGDFSGSNNPIQVTMDETKQITATFTESVTSGPDVQILRFDSQHSFGDDKANSEVIAPLLDMYDTSFYYSDVIPGMHDAGREVIVYWNFLSLWDGSFMFPQAEQNGWALVDSNGEYVYETGHPENKVMDIGSEGYRQMITSWMNEQINVGFDGIFADNSGIVYPQTDWLLSARPMNPRTGELYTDEDWLSDTVGYINYVIENTPDIVFVSNTMLFNGHEYFKPENTQKYDYFLENANIDILFVEGIFTNMGEFYNEQDWLKSLNLVVHLQENFLNDPNKALVLWSCVESGIPVGMSEDQVSLFMFSSSLLGVSSTDQNYVSCHENMDSEITQSLFNIPLGIPLESYHIIQDTHVYERDYSKVKVLVNPTETPYVIQLSELYRTQDGQLLSEFSLDGLSGIILTKIN